MANWPLAKMLPPTLPLELASEPSMVTAPSLKRRRYCRFTAGPLCEAISGSMVASEAPSITQ